ncbi:hypothetical protein [Prosthecobacter sp.]|uniref:hypothetical protein n=1 Tax=Prosthecobacter sp. TaxID=1965333 RepID=UPI002ABC6205|nr:hypothetical protein [Prosthecobacter sp.]MDZ4401295.1 hypothetical protein [Prosthecobacter sp.]
MSILDEMVKYAHDTGGTLSEKKEIHTLEILVAERKAFLSKKKLTYIAKFRVDDSSKELRFTEMLKESGFGLSSGDSGMSPGFGFKTESYSTGFGEPREGSIKEQSSLFGKQYSYTFDFGRTRGAFEAIAGANGYAFKYQVTSMGL